MASDGRHQATLVALATPPGQGAIAMIRMTGRRVRPILDEVLRKPGAPTRLTLDHRRATLAQLVDPADGAPIDEVLVTYFAAPRSYTGEDVAEICLHGGPWLVAEAIRVVTSLGADPARPGEFTRRALMFGKLDLARAEAVQALVVAQSSAAAKLAAQQLAGGLSARYERLRADLVVLGALLEGPLEFPEDTAEDEDRAAAEALALLGGVEGAIRCLMGNDQAARRIVSGLSIPIIGRPNVGKSSIFNGLLGSDRAIVSPRPGTTRDCIEGMVTVAGQLVRLIDTAGIGVALDELDAEAMRRAEQALDEADAVVLVLDRSAPPHSSDAELAERLLGRSVIVVANKSDLPPRLSHDDVASLNLPSSPILASAADGTGLPTLWEKLGEAVEHLSGPRTGTHDLVTSARQRALLARASEDLDRAGANIRGRRSELAVEDVRVAALTLGEILGESAPDAVLDEVFRTFCIGK